MTLAGYLKKSLQEVMEMDIREIMLWRTLHEQEPIGEARWDYLVGMVCSTIYNASGFLTKFLLPSKCLPPWCNTKKRKRSKQPVEEKIDSAMRTLQQVDY